MSYFSGVPVADSIRERLPVDLSLTLVAIATALLVGFAAGIVAAVRRGGLVDRAVTFVASVTATIPEFWLAIMFVSLFAVTLRWLPSGGWVPFGEDPVGWLRHVALPGVSLGLSVAAQVARQLRGRSSPSWRRTTSSARGCAGCPAGGSWSSTCCATPPRPPSRRSAWPCRRSWAAR